MRTLASGVGRDSDVERLPVIRRHCPVGWWVALLLSARAALAPGFGAPGELPKVELPAGLELVVAAAHPLVNYPILGCVDDRGRLFLGDAAGVNLDKKQLEAQLPNRILVLEDANGDGIYDRSTVFADKFTYPSGGFWLDGSLYFASPPGIWKLTDTNGDSVADRRELLVGGFDGYTGNGTHIHSPVFNPTNGRLYWCAGGSGNVVQKDGTPVRNGRATGVWSCQPDGTDIRVHAMGAMANPVEADFTAEGDILGVMNILYMQPRGDTLLHWLEGGVYERADGNRHQRHSGLADLPHTLERMPVMHNFGHVAVSGMTRYRSGALNRAWKDNLFVAFFNTQKVVRVQLARAGATYTATEHEFLKLHDPWMHLTDVMEDADGSLLVLDTGGWLTRGCPSSLGGDAGVRGAVYRVRAKKPQPLADPYGRTIPWATLSPAETRKLQSDERWRVRETATRLAAARAAVPAVSGRELLDPEHPHLRLRACERLAHSRRVDPAQRDALLQMLGESLEPVLEHAALFAAITTKAFDLETLRAAKTPVLQRRLAVVLEQTARDDSARDSLVAEVKAYLDSPDVELARTAIALIGRNPRAVELCYDDLSGRLAAARVSSRPIELIVEVAQTQLAKPAAQKLITAMLQHASAPPRRTAWQILARQSGTVSSPDWMEPLARSLESAPAGDRALLLEAIGKLNSDRFDRELRRIVTDARSPQPLRLKAVAAMSRPGKPLGADAFELLLEMARKSPSPTARIDAARFLTRTRLNKEQLRALAPVLATAGPIELQELLKLKKTIDEPTARAWAEAIAQSAVLGSVDESVIRSGLQRLPARTYESILGPAVRAAAAANDAKKRRLEVLAADVAKGRAAEGRKVFETSACVACHKVGELGRAIGPDLSHIGKIRVPRDILGKILFPNASVSQGYETFVIETGDGQSHTGTIKNDTAEGVLLVDLTGQEKTIPHGQIVGRNALPTSLMPMGLEQTMSEQQLLDLVGWLVSLK